MMPSSFHRVTIGTGERRMRAIEALRLEGHDSIAPRDVELQSKLVIIFAASPPPVRKGWGIANL
jgi:hypothetical protein